jgi:hypothetical protein
MHIPTSALEFLVIARRDELGSQARRAQAARRVRRRNRRRPTD